MNKFIALIALATLSLSACAKDPYNLTDQARERAGLPSTEQIKAASDVKIPTVQIPAAPTPAPVKVEFPPVPHLNASQYMDLSQMPQDGDEFYNRYEHMRQTLADSKTAKYTSEGYLIYDFNCSNRPEGIRCTRDGHALDEEKLAKELIYVRNLDSVRLDWTCNFVCLNEKGQLVGAVQPAATDFVVNHCREEYNSENLTCEVE